MRHTATLPVFALLAASLVTSVLAKPAYLIHKVELAADAMAITETNAVLTAFYDEAGDYESSTVWIGKQRFPVIAGDSDIFYAHALNTGNLVAGMLESDDGDLPAIFQLGSSAPIIISPPDIDASGEARAVNAYGQVVGSFNHKAFLYANGAFTSLDDLGGYTSSAEAINDLGQIAGVVSFSGTSRGYVKTGASIAFFDGLRGADVLPRAMNNRGQVVGYMVSNKGDQRAFLYSGGKVTDLGTLGAREAEAWDINDHGDIVGSSTIKGVKDAYLKYHAFLYTHGRMTDLNDLVKYKETFTYATGINNNGCIAANTLSRFTSQGEATYAYASYLLTPIPTLTIAGAKTRVTHQARINVHGKAHPSSRKVVYRIGQGPALTAHGTKKWRFQAKIPQGTTTISVQAIGIGGRSARENIVVTRN